METGLIGLPLAGKTSIFNALTGLKANLSGPGGGKKQLNIAEIKMPDPRVGELTRIFKPKKSTHAAVVFKDIRVEFSGTGGIAPATLAEIRNTAVIAIVVRAFIDEGVFHPLEKVDPLADLKKIMDSLVFSDYEIIEKRLDRLQKEAKRAGREYQLLEQLSKQISDSELIGKDFLKDDPSGRKLLSGYRFLTAKPIIVVANTGENSVDLAELEKDSGALGVELFPIRGDLEMEIAQLAEEDQEEFLEDLGLKEPAKNRFLRRVYLSLDLISFLTANEEEVRAWSIPRGTTAVKAAGKIHSDLEKGFIRAEVIPFQELLETGGFQQAKKQGLLRLEGKDYIVQDGDVITIRFNV